MSSFLQRLRSVWGAAVQGGGSPSTLSLERAAELEELSRCLNYRFRFPVLLDRALTHRSFVDTPVLPGSARTHDYESLEFLGDAILSFVISEYLVAEHPALSEGELTKARALFVSSRKLHELSTQLKLGRYMRLGKGQEKTGERLNRAILADLFESVVAAIYLDGGIGPARRFILRSFRGVLRKLENGELELKDYKSQLQELLHSRGSSAPTYEILEEVGPDHRKKFTVAVVIEGLKTAAGSGGSKREAAQLAAERALKYLAEGQAPDDRKPSGPDDPTTVEQTANRPRR